MMLPNALSVPVTAQTPAQRRVFTWITGTALFALLCWLAWLRYARPQWPVADPDTWGYLHPGISKLLGGSFEHIYGRNFLYPGWIYLLLRVTDDFRAIAVAQHLLGLGACALVWVIWRRWREWFTASRLPAWADALLGLGLTAFFGASNSAIHYEEQIRPEGVFTFFAALSLSLLLAFMQAWYLERRTQHAALLAGLCLFTTALVYQLKPSFGLAAGVTMLPVALALFVPGQQGAWRPRFRLLGMVAVGGLASAALLVLPEREFARSDPHATLFLPETLLTVHAGIIRDQMNEDVREGTETPYPVRWLTETSKYFGGEVARASDPAQVPYPTLGYNPDYLLYQNSFCRWLDGQLPPAQIARFCYYYYARAWSQRPAAMTAKVGRELGVFYLFRCPAFRSSTRLKVAEYYSMALGFLVQPVHRNQMTLYPPARTYLDAVRGLTASSGFFQTPVLLVKADHIASTVHLPLLILLMAGSVWVGFLARGQRGPLWLPGMVLLLVYGVCFGSCLTIAVVHSLVQHRYTLNLLLYPAFYEVATVCWLVEVVLARRHAEPVVRPAGAAAIPFAGLAE